MYPLITIVSNYEVSKGYPLEVKYYNSFKESYEYIEYGFFKDKNKLILHETENKNEISSIYIELIKDIILNYKDEFERKNKIDLTRIDSALGKDVFVYNKKNNLYYYRVKDLIVHIKDDIIKIKKKTTKKLI